MENKSKILKKATDELLEGVENFENVISNLINNPIGVTTTKNIKSIIIGEKILPRSMPSSYQSLFNGDRYLEFKIPSTKKISDIIKDQDLILSLLIKG